MPKPSAITPAAVPADILKKSRLLSFINPSFLPP
jgi:hypothetical protein